MKRSQLILLIALLLLLLIAGAWLPHAVIALRKSQMQAVVWTQAREETALDFEDYPRQFGEIEISGTLSAQNIKNALEDLTIAYMKAGLLPELDIVNMTMPEFSITSGEQDEDVLEATLQSDGDTLQLRLSSQYRFPVFLSFQSGDLSLDAQDWALLLPQHYRMRGGYEEADDGSFRFVSQDGTLEFTFESFFAGSDRGLEMNAYPATPQAQD